VRGIEFMFAWLTVLIEYDSLQSAVDLLKIFCSNVAGNKEIPEL